MRFGPLLLCLLLSPGLASALPNLRAVSLESDREVAPGGSMHVRFQLEAEEAAFSCRWQLSLSRNGDLSGLEPIHQSEPLRVERGLQRVEAELRLPAQASGSYRLVLQLTPLGPETDANPSDNLVLGDQPLHVVEAPQLLRLSGALPAPQRGQPGETLDLGFVADNPGPAFEAEIGLYLSPSQHVAPQGLRVLQSRVSFASGSHPVQLNVPLPDATPLGHYSMHLIVDPAGQDPALDHAAARLQLGSLQVSTDRLTLRSQRLVDGLLNALYAVQLVADGGDGNYRFSLSQGALAPGLSLNEAGFLSGVPRRTGSFRAEVTVESAGLTAKGELSLVVQSAGTGLWLGAPELRVGLYQPVDLPIQIRHAEGAVKLSLEDAPASVHLSADHHLQGHFEALDVHRVTVRAVDEAGHEATARIGVTVVAPSSLLIQQEASVLSYDLHKGEPEKRIQVSGGQRPYVFEARSELPRMLELSADGVIRWKPRSVGDYAFLLRVTDALKNQVEKVIHLKVQNGSQPPVDRASLRLEAATLRQPYRHLFRSVDGLRNDLVGLSPGTRLPLGLELKSDDRDVDGFALLQGTPQEAGIFLFGLRVASGDGVYRDFPVVLTVKRSAKASAGGCVCTDAPLGEGPQAWAAWVSLLALWGAFRRKAKRR